MSRQRRIDFPGAIHHVMARSVGGKAIFQEEEDRLLFFDAFLRALDRYRWRCLSFCLMNNHYHLLIETPAAGLPRGMRWMNGTFGQGFNQRHGNVGHVFQGRYRSILVEHESYLLEVSRYIALNPVRAGLCRTARDWTWSHYRSFVGLDRQYPWLDERRVLGLCSSRVTQARREYARYVAREDPFDPMKEATANILLGSTAFSDAFQEPALIPEVPSYQLKPKRETRWASRAYSPEVVEQAVREYLEGPDTLKQVAKRLSIHYSTLSRWVSSHQVHRMSPETDRAPGLR